MELLFKRDQQSYRSRHIIFKLWSKVEVDSEEKALIDRYHFHDAILIAADDSHLVRPAIRLGTGIFILVTIFALPGASVLAPFLGGIAGVIAGYWYINEHRETIFVRDLLHGRHFQCESVVELAKKEAWLEGACSLFRQVMESAKHWDGVERHTIEPLPKEQARELIVRSL